MKTKRLFLGLFAISFATACSSSPHQSVAFATSLPPLALQVDSDKAKMYESMGKKFIVAAQGQAAGKAAAMIMKKGGNIIDAAVAASFVISVERPQSTGIGGGGFMLFHEAKSKRTYAVDFRERAPILSSKGMFLDPKGDVVPKKSLDGIFSVGTPGLVAGLIEIHKKFGKLSLTEDLGPAIELAEKGFFIYQSLASAIEERKELLAQYPDSKRIYLHPDGSARKEGELLVQGDLAHTIRTIAKLGKAGFYQGKIAAAILSESKKQGGLLQQADLDQYQVKWREPVRGTFQNLEVASMPPPSSGGIHVIQILNLLENDNFAQEGFLSAESIHRTASAMQLAFADRAVYPGDPDFVKVPTEKLISKAYAKERRALISEKAKPASEVKEGQAFPEESTQTTHFSMMDEEGNAVSSTQTINYIFGSGVVAAGTGIVLNDEMDDFSAKPGVANVFGAYGGEANAVAPKKTPLSSMSPTIVFENGSARMVVGAPGGTRIITCVAQTILNYFAHKQSLWTSLVAVRFHQQWMPDFLDLEAPGPGPAVEADLRLRGHNLRNRPGAVGCRVEAVTREGDVLHGVADPRDVGISIGF